MGHNEPYRSSLALALRDCRSEFVIQLYTRRGPFWEAIRDIRDRWGVTADTRLPEPWPDTNLYPNAAPEGSWDPESPDYSEETYKAWDRFLEQWQGDLNSVVERLVPKRLRIEAMSPGWREFVAACVLYQPPDTKLAAFRDFAMPGGQVVRGPSSSAGMLEKFLSGEEQPRAMVLPPIKQMRDPREEREDEARHWAAVLEIVWELHVKPRGLSFEQMLLSVFESENYRKKVDEWNNNKPRDNGPRYYIEIDEFTDVEDARKAVSMLAEARKTQPKQGRNRRDELIAVQCAILYDKHNARDPKDSRRKKYSYEKLAREFGLPSARSAEAHVLDGRKRLKKIQPKE